MPPEERFFEVEFNPWLENLFEILIDCLVFGIIVIDSLLILVDDYSSE